MATRAGHKRDYGNDPDMRGNAMDRRARRQWLLATFGNGDSAPCAHCGVLVNNDTMHVDRFPTCGHDGGRYTRDNIVPACASCNLGRCATCRELYRQLDLSAELEATLDWNTAHVDDDGQVMA